jgi:tRNA/rRNA methyltransferase
MKSRDSAEGTILKNKFSVILSRPENPENIGLVARGMKNTGFDDLRLVGISSLKKKAFVTAVHAREILENARFYPRLKDAIENLDIIFAHSKSTKEFFPFAYGGGAEKNGWFCWDHQDRTPLRE